MSRRAPLKALNWIILVLMVSLYGPFASNAYADLQVWVFPLVPEGQPVGSSITWYAVPSVEEWESLLYRFSVGLEGGPLTVVRDFDIWNTFEWCPMEEGTYTVRVTMKNPASGESAETTASYDVASRVSGTYPVVSPTRHPLVALYSAPPGPQDGYVRVRFLRQGGYFWQYTPWKPCHPDKSVNFQIAGMRASAVYVLQQEIYDGEQLQRGPLLVHRTRDPGFEFPVFNPIDPPDDQTSLIDSILLHAYSLNGGVRCPVATDLEGNVLWYYDKLKSWWHFGSYLTSPVPGGTMLLILLDYTKPGIEGQVLREIDLVGTTLKETNVPRINEQLANMGRDPIVTIHHEATRVPNGQTLVLGAMDRIVTDLQGPGDVHVLGDLILALDENWQVVWVWDSFEHLDVGRKAVLDETCSTVFEGCPVDFDYPVKDWTHSNTITYSEKDGNLILSMRNQDQVVKIAYEDGYGTGEVLWRFGEEGDFSIESEDPDPWFSHQHGVVMDGPRLLVFDNGNTRCEQSPDPESCHSRGQVWTMNESTLHATLDANTDLGDYSEAYGWSQALSNGDYHFTVGLIEPFASAKSYSLEVAPDGGTNYMLETSGWTYRSYRMRNLYAPSEGQETP